MHLDKHKVGDTIRITTPSTSLSGQQFHRLVAFIKKGKTLWINKKLLLDNDASYAKMGL